jgi:hypothetical protein
MSGMEITKFISYRPHVESIQVGFTYEFKQKMANNEFMIFLKVTNKQV